MRGLIIVVSLSALGAALVPAHAAGGGIWDHNGSKMELEEKGDKRKIVYKELREGLDKAGIRVGTVLFNGEKKPNGRLAGFAKIFKGTCNAIDYFVEGTLDEGKGEIILQGQAPVYTTGTGCEVNGYSDSSPASTLRFTRIGDAPDTAVIAERSPGQRIEQGDGGGPVTDDLPPAPRTASRGAADPAVQPLPGGGVREGFDSRRPDDALAARGRTPGAADDEVDDSEDAFLRPRDRRNWRYPEDDRRLSRAQGSDPDSRRRAGIWDQDEEDEDEIVEEDRGYYNGYERRPPHRPSWGRW